MKQISLIICALCICAFTFAQNKKVETFDKNTWHWTEGSDKYQSVTVGEGVLTVQNLQLNKKATDYQKLAKSFARLPLRPQENFKLTIKFLVADYNLTWYQIWFNTGKQCLEEDPEDFETYYLFALGQRWFLNIGGENPSGILPGKVKIKGEYPMELVIDKKSKNSTIELNGIQLYEGKLQMSNPCIGFVVPYFNKKASYIKVDEIILEQADASDD